MPVRSGRVYGPAHLTNAATELLEVPAGRTLIIRSIVVVLHSGTATNLNIYVNGTSGAEEIARLTPQAANSTYIWDPWAALNPGDKLYGKSGTNAAHTITVFGALLDGDELELPL